MAVKRLVAACFLFLAGCFAVPSAWATPPPYGGGFHHGYEFNPYVTFTHFDSKSEIDDDFGFGMRFGWLGSPNQEVEFTLFDSVYTHDQFCTCESVDFTHFQVAYVYNFTSHGAVPYFTLGMGGVHWHDSDLGTETDPVVAAGFGARFFLGRVAYMRIEGRLNAFRGDGIVFANNQDFYYSQLAFGIGWRFPSP